MNRISFAIAAVALAAASTASFAQSAEEAIPAWVNGQVVQPVHSTNTSTSSLSRADVTAQYLAARDAGQVNSFDNETQAVYAQVKTTSNPVLAQVQQGAERAQSVIVTGKADGLSRADVQAQFFAARASGEISSFDNEPYFHQVSNSRTATGVASAR
jgi:Skp family chaperone for outer membrane proteins